MARWWSTEQGRVRSGWRILLYFFFLAPLFVVGLYTASVLPRTPLNWAHLLLFTVGGLIAGWVMLIRFDGRPPGALGFALSRSAITETAVGFAVGAALIAGAALLLFVTGSAAFVPDEGSPAGYVNALLWSLLFFYLAAAAEEVLFRGYAFQALVEAIGVWPALVGSSATFAFFHSANPNVNAIALANIFLAGLVLGLAYLRTRSLWFATALHAGWNWVMASALGFPVSGLILLDTPLYDAVATGPEWWTGGDFGPEAGLAGTLVLLLGLAWLRSTARLRPAPEVRALRPLVDSRLSEAA
jgi:uncharacterized protein